MSQHDKSHTFRAKVTKLLSCGDNRGPSVREELDKETPVLGGLSLVSKLLALGHLASAITVTWHPLDLGLTGPNSAQQQRHFSRHSKNASWLY